MPPLWEAWYVGIVLLGMIGVVASGRVPTDVTVVGALAAMLVPGIISAREAFVGFAEPAIITIAFLYVVATALKETGAISLISRVTVGRPRSTFAAQARLVGPVAILSAFANNTPIVATFLPVLTNLSRLTGIPVGRLFMPLSFAAILGGLCTLIGTATTLIVAGQWSQFVAALPEGAESVGPDSFSLFTIAPIGLPVAIVGVVYVLVLGRMLLPTKTEEPDRPEAVREYMTAMRVEPGSPIVGQTIEQAGLRHLPGLFLSRVDRQEESLRAVAPHFKLAAGDVLIFVGRLDSVVDLKQIRGLTPVAEGDDAEGSRKARLAEAVVSTSSPLVGRSVRAAGIRTRYGAVVVAVHRLGHKLEGKVGDIILRPGDTLLLETSPGFAARYRDSAEFHLVSELDEGTPRHEKAALSLLVLALFVVALATGVTHPVVCAMLAAGAMIGLRCCTATAARRGMDWTVLIVIGAAFGLGQAMENSGLAGRIAQGLVTLSDGAPPFVLLGVVYFLTVVFTTFITNSAAAVLMFPIAIGVASEAGLAPLPFALLVAIGASAEFTTPLGYHTNLMVMGPGGYRFMDYVRFGGPLTILAGLVAVGAASLML